MVDGPTVVRTVEEDTNRFRSSAGAGTGAGRGATVDTFDVVVDETVPVGARRRVEGARTVDSVVDDRVVCCEVGRDGMPPRPGRARGREKAEGGEICTRKEMAIDSQKKAWSHGMQRSDQLTLAVASGSSSSRTVETSPLARISLSTSSAALSRLSSFRGLCAFALSSSNLSLARRPAAAELALAGGRRGSSFSLPSRDADPPDGCLAARPVEGNRRGSSFETRRVSGSAATGALEGGMVGRADVEVPGEVLASLVESSDGATAWIRARTFADSST